jgi:hypothetical protein
MQDQHLYKILVEMSTSQNKIFEHLLEQTMIVSMP